MNEKADYRNGKYEGQMNIQKQRHGLGIFIDDDLTFYVSHWSQNKINGLSLIYISHGKYIYGQWKNNEPHGLTVFRSGDTVLVGKCKNGKPINKCLVIFERFNFACILQQTQSNWNIIESGQLINYDTLLKYIELIQVPVPEYFFSLTKFVCHFSKNSHLIKTFPCLMNCCYFGYNNGLAIIFNSTNALISIGQHQDEQLCQFGGHFDGIRSVEEGNFENQQTVKYSGQRPAYKIYGIFQKIHKKSLNFLNEYFDSKIKYFNCIEQLLKSKLDQIGNQCRKNKSLKNIDLNDSLQYQQYTQEQSLKMNSIRQNIYEVHIEKIQTPHNKINSKSPLSKAALKQIEDKEIKCQKYFRKMENKHSKQAVQEIAPQRQKIFNTKQKQQQKIQNIKATRQIEQCQLKGYSVIKRSPLAKLDIQKSRKSQISIATNEHKAKQGKYLQESFIPQQLTPSKLKDKIKNNLCYINPNPDPIQQQRKDKNNSVIKSNNIYKQIKNTKRIQDIQLLGCSEKNEESQNYKVPNFNYLNSQTKQQDYTKSNQYNKIYPKQANQTKNQSSKKNQKSQKLVNFFEKSKGYQMKNQYTQNKNENHQLQQTKSKRQLGLSPSRKSIDTSSMSKPSYEDIEQRRKRILKQFKELNQSNPPIVSPKRRQKKIDSPCNNLVFSLSKQQQSSFGYMPITVSEDKRNHTSKKQGYVLIEREDYGQKNIPTATQYKKSDFQKAKPVRSNNSYKMNNYTGNENEIKSKAGLQNQVSTPQRVKKNYQYIYE